MYEIHEKCYLIFYSFFIFTRFLSSRFFCSSFYREYKFYTLHRFLSISHPKARMHDIISDHLVDRADMKMRELSLRNSDCFIYLCKIVSQQICIILHSLRNSASFLWLHINYAIDFLIYCDTR